MSAGKYRAGVRWIAVNDEPGEQQVSVVAGFISVALLADLFGKTQEQVARAVVRERKQSNKETT